MIREILFEKDIDTSLSVVLDSNDEIFIRLESDSGREIFQLSLKQVFKLKYILDEYISDTFEREAR